MTDWARGVRRIAVLTGAGISTDSGIPDYRGPDGIWTRDPKLANLFTLDNFLSDPEIRQRFWQRYLAHPAWLAQPNPAHLALAGLSAGPAVRVLTQNIDGLHQRAGVPARKVLELHGSMHGAVCVGCAARTPTPAVLDRVRGGELDPSCVDCGGILKLAVILFGQQLDGEVIGKARTIAAASEVFLAVGSSLQVEPAASLCAVAVRAGAKLVVVNAAPTPYDEYATEVIREPIGVALPRICQALLAR
ncbi:MULTISPECIES: Sir2 family NAD-dependent protein deacetylase [unclassified Crossiella]|uniref:SIR2 family NAD-dependent protein deacylase n=1 Tax=unclassified Crossiella TaxID=2620835 RepID=UPI001FFFF230|nr:MULTISPECIES: Sir2 family NAD-dependent protein deacetylase [unclassified Crossiella]MCK2245390.1 Sir2 family NAD-dependent protein deacetylase [Crossiella sp. S99.2]MCK2259023.1 Sir2 family NAD-dependent protein deacetylase [Crossiella sp. S99.1]